VAEVASNSAAQSAGIRAGDVITRVADLAVDSAQDFHNLEGQLPLGEEFSLEFVRDLKITRVELAARALVELDGASISHRLQGATFVEIPLNLRADGISGVLISELDRGSQLARSGIRPGDIVTGVGRQAIQNLAQFEQEISSPGGSINLRIWRNGSNYRARLD
jgi:S1-C subfamily serine protease